VVRRIIMRRRIALVSLLMIVASLALVSPNITLISRGHQATPTPHRYRGFDLSSSIVLRTLRRGQIVEMRGILTRFGPDNYQLIDPPSIPGDHYAITVFPSPPTPLLSFLATLPGAARLLPPTADYPHTGTVRVYKLKLFACPSYPACDTPVEWGLYSGG